MRKREFIHQENNHFFSTNSFIVKNVKKEEQSFTVCCDFKTFLFEIDHLRTILRKNNILRILFISVLNHSLINYFHLKLLFRMYLKEMCLLSCRSWKVPCFKFQRLFKNYLVINCHLII